MAKHAQAAIPCTFEHGRVCNASGPGWVYCDTGKICFCNGGHWDCGCFIDEANGQLLC